MNDSSDWKPISHLSLFTKLIDDWVRILDEQYQTILPARDKPHIMAKVEDDGGRGHLWEPQPLYTPNPYIFMKRSLGDLQLKNIPSCMSFFPSCALCQSPNTLSMQTDQQNFGAP
ncbi:MAG: hypothetical protein GY874_20915 [Desulfobacteraceae bacterium]|nr:hypothetical protein [Desulfobacteraceae bacterium]